MQLHSEPTVLFVKSLLGLQVIGRENAVLGVVEDVALDESGKVAYIALAHGGLLGTALGGKHFAVPFGAIAIHNDGQGGLQLTLDASAAELAGAPGYDPQNPPLAADASFHEGPAMTLRV